MPIWKIRVVLSDDEASYEALRGVLASYQVSGLRLRDRPRHMPGTTSELIIELRESQPIGDLLHALHKISPQVLISRADADRPPAVAATAAPARQVRHGTGEICRALSHDIPEDRGIRTASSPPRRRAYLRRA